MNVAVIIPAAGEGRRFADPSASKDQPVNKIELDLAGKPVFMRAVELFLKRNDVGQIIVAVNPQRLDLFKLRWGDKLAFHDVTLAAGGTIDRWETVLKALDEIEDECTHVAIHDAARPMASQDLVDRVFETATHFSAVIPGLPVRNTLKRVEVDQVDPQTESDPLDAILGKTGRAEARAWRVLETIDRSDLYEVQTPQIFELALIRRAYDQVADGKLTSATDDAQLVEALGEPVHIVEGDPTNLKITWPADVQLAELFLQARQQQEAAALGRLRLFADDEDE